MLHMIISKILPLRQQILREINDIPKLQNILLSYNTIFL